MKNMMLYKDYFGSVHYSDDDQVFHGKLEFIRALITYEGTDVQSLQESFRNAVDEYLELCKQENIQPEKPFKGTFNVRTGSDLHRRATLYAKDQGVHLNKIVTEALEHYLDAAR